MFAAEEQLFEMPAEVPESQYGSSQLPELLGKISYTLRVHCAGF